MVSAAKLAYRPVGIVASIAAGAIASAVFKQIWKRVADKEDAPDAMQSEYPLARSCWPRPQGAIFAPVKALIDRGGAKGFQRLTGSWPGD